jgi:hypothetical protein
MTRSSASARSSAASTSATTCASSACPATAPAARSASACRARPTARPRARSPPRACSSSSSGDRPGRFLPEVTDDRLADDVVPSTSTGRWRDPRDAARATRSRPACAHRPARRRPRHRPRQAQGALDRGEGLPDYLKDHPVYYAGPAKTPRAYASGSFGPTTAGRMDSYVDRSRPHGGSLVMLAKGNRSKAVTDACKRHGGFYLGSIGGPAAILARTASARSRCSTTRARHGGGVAHRGRGLPRVHRRGRQGQRLLRQPRPKMQSAHLPNKRTLHLQAQIQRHCPQPPPATRRTSPKHAPIGVHGRPSGPTCDPRPHRTGPNPTPSPQTRPSHHSQLRTPAVHTRGGS